MRSHAGFIPINERRSTWASLHSRDQRRHDGDGLASHRWVLQKNRERKREKLKSEEAVQRDETRKGQVTLRFNA